MSFICILFNKGGDIRMINHLNHFFHQYAQQENRNYSTKQKYGYKKISKQYFHLTLLHQVC